MRQCRSVPELQMVSDSAVRHHQRMTGRTLVFSCRCKLAVGGKSFIIQKEMCIFPGVEVHGGQAASASAAEV